MSLPLALATDWSVLNTAIRESISWPAKSLVALVRNEVLKWTQVQEMKQVPLALTTIVLKESVQAVTYDIQHKIEAIVVGISLHNLYIQTWLEKYLPQQMSFLSDWKASAAVGLGSMFVSRLFFIGLIWPYIRYHKKSQQNPVVNHIASPDSIEKSPIILPWDHGWIDRL